MRSIERVAMQLDGWNPLCQQIATDDRLQQLAVVHWVHLLLVGPERIDDCFEVEPSA